MVQSNKCCSFLQLHLTDLMASMTVELLPRLGCANIVVTGLSGRVSLVVTGFIKQGLTEYFAGGKEG